MIKGMELAWVVVKDLKKAVDYYTKSLGLNLAEFHETFGWAELTGKDGKFRLGLAQQSDLEEIGPGENAVVAFTVDNLKTAVEEFSKKGVKLKGSILEIPGHVKIQTIQDLDGNTFQLVEKL